MMSVCSMLGRAVGDAIMMSGVCVLQGWERLAPQERLAAPAGSRQAQPQSRSSDRDRQQVKDHDSRDR